MPVMAPTRPKLRTPEDAAKCMAVCAKCAYFHKPIKWHCAEWQGNVKRHAKLLNHRCPVGNWNHLPYDNAENAEVVLTITDHVAEKLGPRLAAACEAQGVRLAIYKGQPYWRTYSRAKHAITFGTRISKEKYATANTNTLFMENAIPGQWNAVWIDDEGWFSYSRLCKEREYERTATTSEIAELQFICKRYFGWRMFQGGAEAGPILYAVQKDRDMPALFCFPNVQPGMDRIESGLYLLQKYCPDRRVAVRPHPRCPGEWSRGKERYEKQFRADWTVDHSKNVYHTLTGCSALVTVNSTLAFEAALLGIRVATLGESVFTGSGAWLECGEDPSKLQELFTYERDEEKILNLMGACVRHRLYYNSTAEQILQNESFRRWISKIKGAKPLPPLLVDKMTSSKTDPIDVVLVKYFQGDYEREQYYHLKSQLAQVEGLNIVEWDNNEDNIGLAKARNKALVNCHSEVVVFMDFDLELYNLDWQLMRDKAMQPEVGIVAPVSLGASTIHGGEWEEKEYLSCNFFMFRRQFLEEIDCFDPDYFVFFADWDVIKKTMEAGKKIYQHNHSTLRHLAFSGRTKQLKDKNHPARVKDYAIYMQKWGKPLNRKMV